MFHMLGVLQQLNTGHSHVKSHTPWEIISVLQKPGLRNKRGSAKGESEKLTLIIN